MRRRDSWAWPFGRPQETTGAILSSCEDRRDLRDPESLGTLLLDLRKLHCSRPDHPDDCKLSRVASFLEREKNYQKNRYGKLWKGALID